MGESKAKDGFCLPDEFQLAYDFLLEEAAAGGAGDNRKRVIEQEIDYDELIASLTRRLAMSIPHKEKAVATSPQSTLFGLGRSSSFSSNNCSPDGPSKASSPLSTPFEQPPRGSDDALDLLYAAAGRVVRLGLDEDRGCSQKPGHRHFKPNPVIIQQQLQAAQFYQMRREQLLKQQLAAAWRSASAGRRIDLSSPSTWPAPQKPRHQQQQTLPGSGMRAVFINGSGARKGSVGTGVFLPRHAGCRNEPKKKPPCSTTVLVPARVAQALNLELDEVGVPSWGTGAYFDREDMFNNVRSQQKQPQQLRSSGGFSNKPATVSSSSHEHHHLLPQEWTY